MNITLTISELRNLLTQAFYDGRRFDDPNNGSYLGITPPDEQTGRYNLGHIEDYIKSVFGAIR